MKHIPIIIFFLLSAILMIGPCVSAETLTSVEEGEFVSDMLFGTVVTVLLVTALNIIGLRGRFLLLQIMAFIGLIFSIPFLWQDIPFYIPLMVVATLGNIAILLKGVF